MVDNSVMAVGDRKRMCVQRRRQQAPHVTSQIQGGRGRGGKRGERAEDPSTGSLLGERCCTEYEPISKQEKLRYKERGTELSQHKGEAGANE